MSAVGTTLLHSPGRKPWAMQECRPKGLFYDKFKINVNTSYLSQ